MGQSLRGEESTTKSRGEGSNLGGKKEGGKRPDEEEKLPGVPLKTSRISFRQEREEWGAGYLKGCTMKIALNSHPPFARHAVAKGGLEEEFERGV